MKWLVAALFAVATAFAGVPALAQDLIMVGVGTPVKASGCSGCMQTAVLAKAGSTSGGPSTASSSYASILGGSTSNGTWSTTKVNRQMPIPVAGTIGNFRVIAPTTMLAGSYVFGINIAGSLTAVKCTINTSQQNCADTSDTVTVSPGNLITLEADPTGPPTAQTVLQISFTFTSSVGNESFVCAGALSANASNTTQNFTSWGSAVAWNATEVNVSSLLPTNGTLDRLYAHASATVGANSYSMDAYHNGISGGFVCSLTGTADCNDLTHSIAITATDTASLSSTPNTTPNSVVTSACMRWVPTIAGEAVAMDVATTVPAITTGQTRYLLQNGASANDTAETNELNVAPVAITAKKLFVSMSATVGGTSRSITSRNPSGTPGNLTFVMGPTASTGSDVTHTDSIAAGNTFSVVTVTSGANNALTWFKNSNVICITGVGACGSVAAASGLDYSAGNNMFMVVLGIGVL